MLDIEEREDQELADRIKEYDLQARRLQQILKDTIFRVERLSDLKRWPTEGWDYSDTISTLMDMLPHRPAAQFEAWAREDMEP